MKFEVTTSYLDYLIIEKVIELRVNATPYMAQAKLALNIDLSEGFIGRIENPRDPAKYNIRLLGKVAMALGLKSYQELIPPERPKYDIMRFSYESNPTFTNKISKGKESARNRKYKLNSIVPLTESEIKEWEEAGKPYLRDLEE